MKTGVPGVGSHVPPVEFAMFLQPSKHLAPTVFATAIAALAQRDPARPAELERVASAPATPAPRPVIAERVESPAEH